MVLVQVLTTSVDYQIQKWDLVLSFEFFKTMPIIASQLEHTALDLLVCAGFSFLIPLSLPEELASFSCHD